MAQKKTEKTREADTPEEAVAPVDPASVVVNNGVTVADNAAVHGHFVRVIGGEHKGRYGVLLATSTLDADGWPLSVVIQTRDEHSQQLEVDYADLAKSEAGHR